MLAVNLSNNRSIMATNKKKSTKKKLADGSKEELSIQQAEESVSEETEESINDKSSILDKKIDDHIIECTANQHRIGGYKKDKIDPLTNTDLIKIRYKNIPKSEFIEFYAKKGLIEISIQEKFN